MTFQAAHRSTKCCRIWQCKGDQSGNFGFQLCISHIIPPTVVHAVWQHSRDRSPDAITRYSRYFRGLQPLIFLQLILHLLRQNYNECIPCSTFLNGASTVTKTSPCRCLSPVFNEVPCHWHAAFFSGIVHTQVASHCLWPWQNKKCLESAWKGLKIY